MVREELARRHPRRATQGTSEAGALTEPEASERAAAGKPAPGLHVVATPIGNLGDLSDRALAVLRGADIVACEDTRVTSRLLASRGSKRSLRAYHEHNAEAERPRLLAALEGGKAVALTSDAGTPLISDPGFKLVRAVVDAGHAVFAVPGPSAVMAALSIAGLPTDRFLFQGFLPAKTVARRRTLEEIAAVPATLVFFETGERLAASLADLVEVLGPRPAAIARELTKLHEEVRRGTLDDLASELAAELPPKGEIVLVVGAPLPRAGAADVEVEAMLRRSLERNPPARAASEVAKATGRPRRALYDLAVQLRPRREG